MRASEVRSAVDAVFAAEAARIVSSIVGITGDWDLAEDCLQEAFIRALTSWAEQGVPANPGAWLTTVAKNRAIDQIRRSVSERRALGHIAYETKLDELREPTMLLHHDGLDDRLSLIFTCCHPALPIDARVALTLRTVAGLSIESIARSFIVSESTMNKRLVRARAKIKAAGIPYRVPPPELLDERASGVLAVLYLLFNEGYSSTERDGLIDVELEAEAIRLTRLLVELIGDATYKSEAISLLALMLLHGSRNKSRVSPDGKLIPLDDQNRSLWDHAAIGEAVSLLNDVTTRLEGRRQPGGAYYLQASIAARHAVANSSKETDFTQIAALYRELSTVLPSPVVELNHAIAIAMADGPPVGLKLIEEIDATGALDNYYLLPAARADLLRRLGRNAESVSHYTRAAALAPSLPERDYLNARIASIKSAPAHDPRID